MSDAAGFVKLRVAVDVTSRTVGDLCVVLADVDRQLMRTTDGAWEVEFLTTAAGEQAYQVRRLIGEPSDIPALWLVHTLIEVHELVGDAFDGMSSLWSHP